MTLDYLIRCARVIKIRLDLAEQSCTFRLVWTVFFNFGYIATRSLLDTIDPRFLICPLIRLPSPLFLGLALFCFYRGLYHYRDVRKLFRAERIVERWCIACKLAGGTPPTPPEFHKNIPFFF